MKSRWMLRQTTVSIKELARKTGLNEVIATCLINRGITEEVDMKKFINGSLKDLHSPFLMKDMENGVNIIIQAIEDDKNIVIYGDYDADGVTSTVILYKALCNCDAKVKYYIPDREAEGYGMSSERITKLKEEGTEVIITCDNGIAAIEEVNLAKSLGMTVIITDHHEVSFVEDEDGNRNYTKPMADAIINPKQKECSYPFKTLCGAGIAYKFAQALYEKKGIGTKQEEELIEFAGIGTICDIVDLVGENRIIVKNALRRLNTTSNIGLKALIEKLGMEGKIINSGTIGFQIGPCINATGRLETAALSVELLLSVDWNRSLELATILNDLNKKRQELTIKCTEEIIDIVEREQMYKEKVLVVYKEDIHESIAGIVAGKVREKFNMPTIVLSKGKKMPKGSGRSIEEYNLFEELLKCKHLIHQFGGHPMAAGLSILEENISILRKELNCNCQLSEEDLTPKIRIDRRVDFKEISIELAEALQMLEPFGKGNPAPSFAEKKIKINAMHILGKDKNTLKLSGRGQSGAVMDIIGFGKVEEFREMLQDAYGEAYESRIANSELYLDVIFSISINEYQGRRTAQLRMADFRISN